MGQTSKPTKVIIDEICQLFSALRVKDQEDALGQLEDLMALHKGKESTEKFRRMVIAELIKLQTKH